MQIEPTFTLEGMWEKFQATALAGLDPHSLQCQEMKKAFYAGAWDSIQVMKHSSQVHSPNMTAAIIRKIDSDFVAFKDSLLQPSRN